ncbi:MAG TPA: hypothetical protein VII40_16685 [Xanthobacteraceae bacterium]
MIDVPGHYPWFRALFPITATRPEFSMWITSDEAVVMFARYCRARFGGGASGKVRAKAKALRKCGDVKGHDVWNQVADEIDKGTSPRSRRPSIN